MNRKRIKAVLKYKFEEFLGTVKDSSVRAMIQNDSIITGGSIVSLLTNEPVNDFDMYFGTKKTALAVAEYYVKEFNEINGKQRNAIGGKHNALFIDGAGDIAKQVAAQGEELWETTMLKNIPEDRVKIVIRSDGISGERPTNPINAVEDGDDVRGEDLEKLDDPDGKKEKYRPIFLSTNAITLADNIQIIIRFYGTAKEIHSNFDFIHCTNWWDSNKKELFTSTAALEAIMSKTLFYSGSKYPLCSIIRTRKFLKRGWNINAGQYLKMCFQLNELDLTNVYILEDQLVGVDTAYFLQVISALSKHIDRNPDATIDSSYVCSVIDKIF